MAQDEAEAAVSQASAAQDAAWKAQDAAWDAKEEVDSLRAEVQTGFAALGEAIMNLAKEPADDGPRAPEKKGKGAAPEPGEEKGKESAPQTKHGWRWRADS